MCKIAQEPRESGSLYVRCNVPVSQDHGSSLQLTVPGLLVRGHSRRQTWSSACQSLKFMSSRDDWVHMPVIRLTDKNNIILEISLFEFFFTEDHKISGPFLLSSVKITWCFNLHGLSIYGQNVA